MSGGLIGGRIAPVDVTIVRPRKEPTEVMVLLLWRLGAIFLRGWLFMLAIDVVGYSLGYWHSLFVACVIVMMFRTPDMSNLWSRAPGTRAKP